MRLLRLAEEMYSTGISLVCFVIVLEAAWAALGIWKWHTDAIWAFPFIAHIPLSTSLLHFELTRPKARERRSRLIAALQALLQISISIVSPALGICCFSGYSVTGHDLIQSSILLLGNGLCVLSMALYPTKERYLKKEQEDQRATAKDVSSGTCSIRSATSTTRLVENDDIELVDCPT